MNETMRERAIRQLAEVERLRTEAREATKVAKAAQDFANKKDEEALEAQKAANAAQALASAKRDECEKLLAEMADEWRDKTKSPD